MTVSGAGRDRIHRQARLRDKLDHPIEFTGPKTVRRVGDDYVWAAVVVVATASLLASIVGVLWSIGTGAWPTIFALPVSFALHFWVGVGAWRRTSWHQHT